MSHDKYASNNPHLIKFKFSSAKEDHIFNTNVLRLVYRQDLPESVLALINSEKKDENKNNSIVFDH